MNRDAINALFIIIRTMNDHDEIFFGKSWVPFSQDGEHYGKVPRRRIPVSPYPNIPIPRYPAQQYSAEDTRDELHRRSLSLLYPALGLEGLGCPSLPLMPLAWSQKRSSHVHRAAKTSPLYSLPRPFNARQQTPENVRLASSQVVLVQGEHDWR